jgi:hypothetical protein
MVHKDKLVWMHHRCFRRYKQRREESRKEGEVSRERTRRRPRRVGALP